ncbi:MAG TPA: hypothetical protein VEZ40_19160, partial [Pyrinomonadaceae bacterium]|nr:hypothetical protein [Pyrinomonadaceae bacterium]
PEEGQTQAHDQAAASQNHQSRPGSGTLSTQPEAIKLGRALGKRLMARGEVESHSTGTLTAGDNRQQVHITRRRMNTGEDIIVGLTGGGRGRTTFTWDAVEGVKTSGGRGMEEDERLLIERLVYDHPDYFVLAQLGGASYYTVARHVRPADAGSDDNYAGSLWDVVCVRESVQGGDGSSAKQQITRLYYLNIKTNLIDKVVTPHADETQTVVAEIAAWEERGGERVPAHIIWRRGAEVLMQYRQATFAHTTGR